jgi:uncharacterized lipoprotein YajG
VSSKRSEVIAIAIAIASLAVAVLQLKQDSQSGHISNLNVNKESITNIQLLESHADNLGTQNKLSTAHKVWKAKVMHNGELVKLVSSHSERELCEISLEKTLNTYPSTRDSQFMCVSSIVHKGKSQLTRYRLIYTKDSPSVSQNKIKTQETLKRAMNDSVSRRIWQAKVMHDGELLKLVSSHRDEDLCERSLDRIMTSKGIQRNFLKCAYVKINKKGQVLDRYRLIYLGE